MGKLPCQLQILPGVGGGVGGEVSYAGYCRLIDQGQGGAVGYPTKDGVEVGGGLPAHCGQPHHQKKQNKSLNS